MEGQETSELDPCQGKLQKDLDFVHILIYAVLGVKPTYIRDYRFKSHVYHFHMFLGMFKDTSKNEKWSTGSKESAAGHEKVIQRVIHLES